ncbi:Hypothetical predicted protein [Olea europaea subsp. europaea]|uniref:Uncharacterized protein n=1 Tax=Olea europaea subsp. europaea TaxID=158383 RepID=A0A8S0RZ93_OLEEU|nr:Hypothetical predicted protein [Olea europaea subsp. europaea]
MSPQQSQVLSPRHPHVQGANHAPSPQQRAFAIHLAKERQLQHQFLQEQQRQFAAANTLTSHGQLQPQLPISSPTRNSAQIQPQTSSPVSLAPSTSASSMNSTLQHQQKHHLPSPVMVRNAQTCGSGLTNQMGKQQPRHQQQQLSQANRQHPQQRQQSQSQQQTKNVKGVGRGNLMMHQSIQIDLSLSNGLLKSPGNQSAEKGEATNLMQDDLTDKPQTRDSETEQHPASISSEIGVRTMLPQPCNYATNVSQVSPTSSPHWNASEHSFDPLD